MRERVFTVVFMVAVAAAFTAAVSAVHLTTRLRVELNRELAEKRVVLEVFGIGAGQQLGPQELDRLYRERVRETDVTVQTEAGPTPVLEGRSEEGAPLGYAFKVAGRGFWDRIRGYVAVEPDLRTLRGLSFFEQSETPGLGAEITKDWFSAQFRGLTLPEESGPDGRLIHLVQAGQEGGPHDVDAVTGATGTSDAVERFLNTALRGFLAAMRCRSGAGQGGGDG